MASQAVLSGVRVLSLEQVHVLPWGTAFLADFGAEVIRVESAEHMNDRRSAPFLTGSLATSGGTKAVRLATGRGIRRVFACRCRIPWVKRCFSNSWPTVTS